jgi:acetyl/propionyl-CoA carboxylase alpha subunit
MKEVVINLKRVAVDGVAEQTLRLKEFLPGGVVSFESPKSSGRILCRRTRDGLWVFLKGHSYLVQSYVERKSSRVKGGAASGAESGGEILSPMPGKIFKVLVSDGEIVKKGQEIIILEAMKMEHALLAAKSGTVKLSKAIVGDLVQVGMKLADIE